MNDRWSSSALRELRADLARRPVIVGMLALGVILGISGPFDTLRLLPALPRILYWTTVVVLTFGAGSLVSILVHRALRARPPIIGTVLASCAIGITVTGIVSLLNLIVFGNWYATWAAFLEMLATVTLIAGVVETGFLVLKPGAGPDEASDRVPLLERLPLDKRGALVALSAEDHYVRVTTAKGEDLVLMRLTDAIAEAGATPGVRIHRSHWVALGAVARVERSGERGEVTLSDGTIRPISRGYMPQVRAAGLLPRPPGS